MVARVVMVVQQSSGLSAFVGGVASKRSVVWPSAGGRECKVMGGENVC